MAKKTEIKFTQDELDSLQELRTNYANIELSLGKLVVQELNEKYGAGNLDPETGVFTPTK